MTKNGLRTLSYLVESHQPWHEGKNVTEREDKPGWYNRAYVVNQVISRLLDDNKAS